MNDGKYLNLSQSEYEKLSVVFIIKIKEKIEEQLMLGLLREDFFCGRYAKVLEEMIWCFFGETREDCGLDHPSSLLSIAKLLEFFDKTLETMSHYRPDLLSLDWQGKWQTPENADENTDEY